MQTFFVWLIQFSGKTEHEIDALVRHVAYKKGMQAPRYPVPAIREHYEFGWSLSKSQPVLMHWVQGPY